jgi:hypothetical protein
MRFHDPNTKRFSRFQVVGWWCGGWMVVTGAAVAESGGDWRLHNTACLLGRFADMSTVDDVAPSMKVRSLDYLVGGGMGNWLFDVYHTPNQLLTVENLKIGPLAGNQRKRNSNRTEVR